VPSPATAKWPKPKGDDEFEDIAVDFVRIRWDDPNATRYGRRGQRQHGVDILGRPPRLAPERAGAQCKNTDELTLRDVILEVEKAKMFPGGLAEFLLVTTADRDAKLQAAVDAHFEHAPAPFSVRLAFWNDVVTDLAVDPDLVRKHWGGFPGPSQPLGTAGNSFTEDDHLVLSALAEHQADDPDDLEPERHALTGIELAVRTGLTTSKVRVAVDILCGKSLLDRRPWGAGEGVGLPFKFSRAWLTANGERALAGVGVVSLPGVRLRPFDYVPINFPDTSDLPWALQSQGYKVEWVYEHLVQAALTEGAALVEGETGRQFRSRDQLGDLLLLRSALPEPSEEETVDLIKQRVVGLVYIRREGDMWVARHPVPIVNPLGGPPAASPHKVLASGTTRLDILAQLRIKPY
jgi:hypothetical protein